MKKTPILSLRAGMMFFSELTLNVRTLYRAVGRLYRSESSHVRYCYLYCSWYCCGKPTAVSSTKVIFLPSCCSLSYYIIDHYHYTLVAPMKTKTKTKCFDCGLPYTDPGFQDLLIPDWAWIKIAPEKGNGLLCPTCICRRLEKARIRNCPSEFMSGALKP